MADIQGKILSKYGIDIAQENIFKLYKIESADISPEELETKIQETRKRWNTSINGANEKNAERDRARLDKADQFESVLKDVKLRKQVFAYYNKPKAESSGNGAVQNTGSTGFAKEYFSLVATTKRIRKSDVDFFFKFYPSERKNKKAILEMLNKELKIKGLGKEGTYADDDEASEEGEKKNTSSPFLVNLFQEATVLKIQRAIEKYEEAVQSNEVCQRYPKLREGLYEFLEIKDVEDAKQFSEIMFARGKEAYALRQERGIEYVPLVDMFNILQGIADYQDVVDNIPEFKLLLKYPNLTPYMFEFVEMKPNTIKGIVNVAKRDYAFRDDTDFILTYYKEVHDNFGISDSGIGAILRKAEKKAKQNQVLNNIDEKLGRNKNKGKMSVIAEIIHWLAYWPIFAMYFVFEVAKVIFTHLSRLAIPVTVVAFLLESWLLPKAGIDNILVLKNIFVKNQWVAYLSEAFSQEIVSDLEVVLLSIMAILVFILIYVLPCVFVYFFVSNFADDFNKKFDWMGIERTFRQCFSVLKKKSEEQYKTQKNLYVKNKILKCIINLVCLAFLIAVIHFIPIGISMISEKTGYFRETPVVQETVVNEVTVPDDAPIENAMEIIESSANIRSGPSTDAEIIMTANKGDVFVATGDQEIASNGSVWYEIYLDGDMVETGWASEKVIAFQ